MAKITVSFFRKVYNQFGKEEISMSRMVEMLNEEASREPSSKELGIFSRDECVFSFCGHSDECQSVCKYPMPIE